MILFDSYNGLCENFRKKQFFEGFFSIIEVVFLNNNSIRK